MSFAENLKKARTEAGMTQKQLADAIGLDRSEIAHYERGVSKPNFDRVPKICNALNITVEKLFEK